MSHISLGFVTPNPFHAQLDPFAQRVQQQCVLLHQQSIRVPEMHSCITGSAVLAEERLQSLGVREAMLGDHTGLAIAEPRSNVQQSLQGETSVGGLTRMQEILHPKLLLQPYSMSHLLELWGPGKTIPSQQAACQQSAFQQLEIPLLTSIEKVRVSFSWNMQQT